MLDRNPQGSFGIPQGSLGTKCGDKYIAMLEPHTGSEYKYKNHKSPVDNWTDDRADGLMERNIILPLREFQPIACSCMR